MQPKRGARAISVTRQLRVSGEIEKYLESNEAFPVEMA
jgi:hypothetical protein